MKILLVLLTLILTTTACQRVLVTPKPTKSPLELQAIQTKEFEASQKQVFGAVLTVFQDNGYMMLSAGMDTGLIVAKSPAIQEGSYWSGFTYREKKATAYIEEISPRRTKVRINFVTFERLSYELSKQEHEVPIEDAQIYQDTFNKIQQAVFMKQNVH